MTCPACGAELLPGQDRCGACGSVASPPTEGSLAPDPLARSGAEQPAPLREIPGLRRKGKEKSWKDEVRERVRHRRRERADELPLFRETEAPAETGRADARAEAPADPYAETLRMAEPDPTANGSPEPVGDEPAAELPLRPREPEPIPLARSPFSRESLPEEDADAEPTEPAVRGEASRPVERPARALERAEAAALDLALLLGIWAVVLYFAGRAARVAVVGLLPAWTYVCAYFLFLGLTYAAYFTGVTGQTLGKMALGLRVVDTSGRPPGCLRALLRAALGTLGIALAGAGLVSILFDPARRALHDRLLRTRVVK